MPEKKKSIIAYWSPKKVKVGETIITFMSSVRNLGLIFTADITLDWQIIESLLIMSCIRSVPSATFFLNTLLTVFSSCLFYLGMIIVTPCLLAGCPAYSIYKLQKVQISAACLVLKARKQDHVTPSSPSFSTLVTHPFSPSVQAVCYVLISVLDFPAYFSKLLLPYIPASQFHFLSDDHILTVPVIRRTEYGYRIFSY